ncbi:MAG: dockerin type I domain-containing protein, partial [Candidatus Poribacteria bacterium]|nr:dockerin type I domain-containing protein [Candidatus Poribacteria bacterium]
INAGKAVHEMQIVVTTLIVLAMFSVNGFSQEYTRWHLPEGARARLGKGTVNGIAYSPDGERIAVASSVGIWLYDTETYKEMGLLVGHTGRVNSVAFSPDGELLASGGTHYDGAVNLWNAKSGEHLFTLDQTVGQVNSLTFSSDSKWLASGSYDTTVRLWDTRTGERLHILPGHADEVESVAFSPDDALIASTGGFEDGTLRLWDARTGENLWTRTAHVYAVTMVAFDINGETIVTGGTDGKVRQWDAATGQLRRELTWIGDPASVMIYYTKNSTIAIGGYNGNAWLWSAESEKLLERDIRHRRSIRTLAFSPDGGTLASASGGGLVRFWDTKTGDQKGVITGHSSMIDDLAFSSNNRLVAGATAGEIRLWDANTGARLRAFAENQMDVSSVAFSPDDSLIAGGGDGTIRLWDVNTGSLVRTFTEHPGEVGTVAFSPDGMLIAGGGDIQEYTIRLWDAATAKLLHVLPWHTYLINSVVFNPDGDTLAVGSGDRSVTLWDARAGELQRTLAGQDREVVSVAYSRDGLKFASATPKKLNLWNTSTWDKVLTLISREHEHSDIAFHPTGKSIARGSFDQSVRVWNTTSGELEYVLKGHHSNVTNVAFSTDGKTLASGGWDGTVILWDIDPYPPEYLIVSVAPALVTSPPVGRRLAISIDIAAGEDVLGFQASVRFDAAALRYVEAAAGDYLPADAFFVPPVIDGNRVTLGGTAFHDASEGGGTLATLVFEVLEPKQSVVTLLEVSLVNSDGERLLPHLEHGWIVEPEPLAGDVNGDGEVNILDLVQVAANFTKKGENDADVNGDGVVDIIDLVTVAKTIGGGAAPSAYSPDLSIIGVADVERWLDQARGVGVGDANFRLGIRFLEGLLAALTPKETMMLPNYPNPFNPETWIPYRLAHGAEVNTTIYDAKGTLVRRLALGFQSPGFYEDRGKAAYWDGRNERGEAVASGVYFYRLRAGDFAASRRMVIVK